jgi:transcriptional regulator with XRE-family HTH domain
LGLGVVVTKGRGSYKTKPLNPSTLGERIRAVRISWGWTLNQLGDAVHYSAKAVWHWEKGKQMPGDPALGAVADLFGLTAQALCTGVGFKIPDPPRQMGALLVAENYAADMVVLPPNDAEDLIYLEKDTGAHERVSLNRLIQTIRAARDNHRPVWLVVGPPVYQSGAVRDNEPPD